MVLLKNEGVLPISRDTKKIALIGPHADCARKFFGGYTQMCMMESTYAVANSIAGVSGSENVDNKKIITVPGTNIQSDETEEFDEILKRQKPGCRSLLEELREKMPDAEIIYAYGYPIAGADTSRFAGGAGGGAESGCGHFNPGRQARYLFHGIHGRRRGRCGYQSAGMPGCLYQAGGGIGKTYDRGSF